VFAGTVPVFAGTVPVFAGTVPVFAGTVPVFAGIVPVFRTGLLLASAQQPSNIHHVTDCNTFTHVLYIGHIFCGPLPSRKSHMFSSLDLGWDTAITIRISIRHAGGKYLVLQEQVMATGGLKLIKKPTKFWEDKI